MRDGSLCKEIVLQFLIEARVFATNPLQDHRRMFFFFIAIVSKDSLEVVVLTCINPLVIPIDLL